MGEITKRTLVEAGKLLAGHVAYPVAAEALEAFRLAHAWRMGHLTAMRMVRSELAGRVRRTASGGRSDTGDRLTAGRLKRMISIRKKLRATDLTLYSIQDIGGCRAIVPDMEAVDRLTEFYSGGLSIHGAPRPYDYISRPKMSGYRSRHFVLPVNVGDSSSSNRRRIEVQVRTQLQHSWATAVEAVGLMQKDDLKGGTGDVNWLRLFQLMAGEMAESESCPAVPGVALSAAERRLELRDLNSRLQAVKTLTSYNEAIRRAQDSRSSAGTSFLVNIDVDRGFVDVRSNPWMGAPLDSERLSPHSTATWIEVDRVDDLLAAYPNYFVDVRAFTHHLRWALDEERARRHEAPKWGKYGELIRRWRIGVDDL